MSRTKSYAVPFTPPMMNALLDDLKTETRRIRKPTYKAGDLLYATEHWRVSKEFDDYAPSDMAPRKMIVTYEAGGYAGHGRDGWRAYRQGCQLTGLGRFRNSMFMPKWASRCWMECLEVRQERVQDITEEGARAEGARRTVDAFGEHWGGGLGLPICDKTARDWYARLWDSINGHGSWASNPMIYMIRFRKLEELAWAEAA